jgi:hypothetical protein
MWQDDNAFLDTFLDDDAEEETGPLGVDIDVMYNLFDAVYNHDVELFIHLLRLYPNVNVNYTLEQYLRVPLLVFAAHCIRHNDVHIIRLLLAHGANVNAKSNYPHIEHHMMNLFEKLTGKTPLFSACQSGRMIVIEYLLQNGADPDIPDNQGMTPLLWASKSGHFNIVDLLCKANANVNATYTDTQTDLFWSALSAAAVNKHEFIVYYLLLHGADPRIGFVPTNRFVQAQPYHFNSAKECIAWHAMRVEQGLPFMLSTQPMTDLWFQLP